MYKSIHYLENLFINVDNFLNSLEKILILLYLSI